MLPAHLGKFSNEKSAYPDLISPSVPGDGNYNLIGTG